MLLNCGEMVMSSSQATRSLRSGDGETVNGETHDDLFESCWDAFVIRHDMATGKFNWFTECGDMIVNRFIHGKKLTAAKCR